MLSSGVREILATTEAVIVDEIHAVAQTKRGSHLALTLERLDHLVRGRAWRGTGPLGRMERSPSNSGEVPASPPPMPPPRSGHALGFSGSGSRPRSGRSSGSRKFLVGPKRECKIVDAGRGKELDLEIVVPVEDMADPGAPAYPTEDGPAADRSRAERPRPLDLAGDLPEAARAGPGTHLDDHLRQQPPRRRAPRQAPERAGQRRRRGGAPGDRARRATSEAGRRGRPPRRAPASLPDSPRDAVGDRPRPPRVALPRGADAGRGDAEVGPAPLPRRDLLPGARDRHGRRRPGDPGRVAEVGDPRPAADRPRRPRARRGLERPDLPQIPRRPARVRGGRPADARRGDRGDGDPPEPARRARPAPGLDGGARRVGGRRGRARSSPRPSPSTTSPASSSRTSSTCSTAATPPTASPSCARGSSGTAPRARSTAAKASRQLVVTNAGTIPDRGLYGVHLPDGRRVGELDEEMVYEARPGQTFLLGATTWRIEEITRDRVIVTPAPGAPGAVPFWRGDGIGRPAELGRAIGAFAREAVSREPAELAAEYDLDPRAANNLVTYLREQQDATRVVPSDETIVVERFRDEIGDWRLCILSPYGGRVHAAWGLALAGQDPRRARPRGRRDLVRRRHRHPPPRRRRAAARRPGPDRARRARGPDRRRALRLGPVRRPLPRERLPLAADPARLPRQAHAALAAAAEVAEPARGGARLPPLPGHPRDLPRVPAGRPRPARARPTCCDKLHARQLSLVEVETPTASPFASSLLFDYVATYMYEGDTPNAERRAAALALDRDLLRELLGQEELRELIDPEALDEVEAQLQHRTEAGRAGDRDALQQLLRNLGDLTAEECGGAGRPRATRRPRCWRSWSPSGASPRCGSPARSATSPPRTPASTATRSACRRRPGCRRPSSRTTPTRCAPWSAATPAPTAPSRPRSWPQRYGVDPAPGPARAGERRGAGPRRAAARRDRARVVRLRRPAPGPPRQPRPPAQGGRGGRPHRARPLPAELAERRRLPPRRRRPRPPARGAGAAAGGRADPEGLGGATCCRAGSAPTRQSWLDELCTSGELVWIGAGALGPQRRPRRPLLPRGRPPRRAAAGQRQAGDRRRARSTTRSASGSPPGPSFWLDLLADLDHPAEELHNALWDLAWVGRGDQRRLLAAAGAAPARGARSPNAAGPPLRPPPLRPPAPPSRAAGR